MTDKPDIQPLADIMAQLRDPDSGCPWDIEQDFASIAPYTIEEAYEVADAIERQSMPDLRDELGDLLLQVVFHARMAEEAGHFTLQDVIQSICDKMIRRHPHVFGDTAINSAEEQSQSWEDIKAEERRSKGGSDAKAPSVLDDVPTSLPALLRAVKLQKRAARTGFDWPDVGPVLDKLEEELAELKQEIANDGGRARIASEMGDILFVYANLARHLGVDAEDALRGTNAKFVRRFQFIEEELRHLGKDIHKSNLEEMDAIWDKAKAAGL